MMILGITGGIASGKSTVTRMFADLGAPTSSADDIARELLVPGSEVARSVAAAFPQAVVSGSPETIDRRALGALIFADPNARKRLESITHPPIVDRLRADIDAFRNSNAARAAAVEIPLLFEAGLTGMVDRVVVVACDVETQIRRLCERLGIDRTEAEQQLSAQWPLPQKVAAADFVVDSEAPLDRVRERVRGIWDRIETD